MKINNKNIINDKDDTFSFQIDIKNSLTYKNNNNKNFKITNKIDTNAFNEINYI